MDIRRLAAFSSRFPKTRLQSAQKDLEARRVRDNIENREWRIDNRHLLFSIFDPQTLR